MTEICTNFMFHISKRTDDDYGKRPFMIAVYINPIEIWDKEHCCTDQHIAGYAHDNGYYDELEAVFKEIGLSEDCEAMFESYKYDYDELKQKLIEFGFKENPEFSNYMSCGTF